MEGKKGKEVKRRKLWDIISVIIDWLKRRLWGIIGVIIDWLTIYTWTELWILVSVPTVIVVIWALFSYLLTIPNDLVRTIVIWTLIFSLVAGAATVDKLRKGG